MFFENSSESKLESSDSSKAQGITDDQIYTAVNYWVSSLESESGKIKNANSYILNKTALATEEGAAMLADRILKKPKNPQDRIQKFKEVLTEKLIDSRNSGNIMLMNDFAPQFLLGDAADESNIDIYSLPRKTTMVLYSNGEIKLNNKQFEVLKAPKVAVTGPAGHS
jgi:hypothetical protein